jgi:hypothetical protein
VPSVLVVSCSDRGSIWASVEGGEEDDDAVRVGEGRVEGETGDGSCVFRVWFLVEGFCSAIGLCSYVAPPVTIDRADAMKTGGISWGRHISHRDFTA